ncbi:hypothetical protein GCM10009616_35710 [Microlunatus lacustris]
MPRPVSTTVTADVAGFQRGANLVGSASRQMAATVTGSARGASRAMDGMSSAADKLAKAERRAADAAGAVRVAESRLKDVRDAARGSTKDLQAAEEKLAAAKAKAGGSAKQVEKAEKAVQVARQKASLAATDEMRASEGLSRSARKLAAAQREVTQSRPEKLGFLDGVEEQSASLDRIGGSLTKVGIAGAAALAGSAKAAMDWESAWAGVTKTVDFSNPAFGSAADQASRLEGELRGMAKTMPTAHKEIAAVAEAAGALGVKTQDVAAFTKTMVMLGDTTNVTADDAATSLAQFMNVMNTSADKVGNLGAALVYLGNNGASTEKQILELGGRAAAAGGQIGLAESDVLGFASAIASTGMNVEAGGTAISKVFTKINTSVQNGGEGLEKYASVAGVSARDFADAFKDAPAEAIDLFVEGLGRIKAEGGDVNGTLKDLGIRGSYEIDTLGRLAGASQAAGRQIGLLSENLVNGKQGFEENNALLEEAAKRYATTESQARIAWNQIKDASISAGSAMLPILAQVATAAGAIAEAFADLPEPVRIAGTALGVTVTAMALIGGLGIKGATGLAALRTAYVNVGGAATFAGRAMKIATLSIPVVGALLFAATTAMQMFASRTTEGSITANSFSDAMQTVEGNVTRATAALNENVRMAAVQELQQKGALDRARQLGLSLGLVTDAALGNKDALAEVNSVIDRYSGALDRSKIGSHEQFEAAMRNREAAVNLRDALGGVAESSADAIAAENLRRDAMNSASGSTDSARNAAVLMSQASEDLTKQQGLLAAETQKVIDKFTILNEGALGVERANQAWEESVDAVTATVKSNRQALDEQVKAGKLSKDEADARARSLDVNTEAGRRNRASITGQITALNDKVTADFKANVETKGLAKATDIAAEALRKGKKRIDETTTAAGLSKDEVKRMQDRMLKTPKELKTDVNTPGVKGAQDEIKTLQDRIKELKNKDVTVTASLKLKADRAIFDKMGIRVAGVNSPGGNTRADGGPVPTPKRASGGPIIGHGGPREDNIAGIDRETGLQSVWVSNREFITNAKAYEANRQAVEQINAGHGRKFEVRPLADGGTVSRRIVVEGKSSSAPDPGSVYASTTKTVTSGVAAYAKALAKSVASEMNAASAAGSSSYTGKGEQGRNAAIIASVGSSMGRRAQIIGIATAIVESGLRNVNYGDRDSLGLFQQRAPWGPASARLDPRTSAGMFYHGGRGGQPGLDDIRGWNTMPMGQAAQRVQVSAFPGRYAQEIGKAEGILAGLRSSRRVGGSDGSFDIGGGQFLGGTKPASGGGDKHSGYPWAEWSGDFNDPPIGMGSPVRAWNPGKVISTPRLGYSYGHHIKIAHAQGIRTLYAHLSSIGVKPGQGVRGGQVIGEIGSTGNSSGPHLHFEKYNRGGLVQPARLYDTGGLLPPGRSIVQNNTGRNELVLNPAQMKAFGFAAGGSVGPAPASSFGSSTQYSVASVVALIRALQQPIKDLAAATAAYNKELAKARAGAASLKKPKAALDAADRKYDRAVDRRQDLRDEVAALKKKADATKGTTAADRAYKKAQAELTAANNAVTRSSSAKQKAQEAYNKAAEKAKVSSDALKEAQAQLAEQQKAVADTARSLSDTFRDAYTSKSTDANDWIALMREGASDIGAFTTKIQQLRKAGLSETLVQQIVGMGAIAGTDVAAQIVKGGKGMVDGLNKANLGIQDAADKLGYTGAIGQGRFAAGGPVHGPGTWTSDSIAARLSKDEWVVPAAAATIPENRRALEQMTYGSQRRVIERNYAQSYASGGPVYVPSTPAGNVDQSFTAVFQGPVVNPDEALRKAETRRRNQLTMRGLGRRV